MPNRLVPGASERRHREFFKVIEKAWRELGADATREEIESYLEAQCGESVSRFLRRYQDKQDNADYRRKTYRLHRPKEWPGPRHPEASQETTGVSRERGHEPDESRWVELVEGKPETRVMFGERFERSGDPKLFFVLLARIWPEPVGRPSAETVERAVCAKELTILPPRSAGAAYSVAVALRDTPEDRVRVHDIYRTAIRERLAAALSPDGRAGAPGNEPAAESVIDHFRYTPGGTLALKPVADELWKRRSDSVLKRIRRAYDRRWPAVRRDSKYVTRERGP